MFSGVPDPGRRPGPIMARGAQIEGLGAEREARGAAIAELALGRLPAPRVQSLHAVGDEPRTAAACPAVVGPVAARVEAGR